MDNIALRSFTPADADWVISRHGALYAADEGYDDSFRQLVADIVAGFLSAHDPACERGWIAERQTAQGPERLGSIFVVREAEDVAKLRLVLLEPKARGTGLARHMLDQAMGFARDAGYGQMRLWTHESHVAAGKLYARAGFQLVSAQPTWAFGQAVVDQIWQCKL